MNSTRDTEEQLREVLATVANAVPVAQEDFRTARGGWRRRERRRRLVLAVLVAVVFSLAVLAGLWVLNAAPSRAHVIFNSSNSPAAFPVNGGFRPTG